MLQPPPLGSSSATSRRSRPVSAAAAVMSSFPPSLLLPEAPPTAGDRDLPTPPKLLSSPVIMSDSSDSEDSAAMVFDEQAEHQDRDTLPTDHASAAGQSPQDEPASYDLKPPPPSVLATNVETLAERLYSIDHLRIILQDPIASSRFNAFLHNFQPRHAAALDQYVETQKAARAIEYANSLVQQSESTPANLAAMLDPQFEEMMRQMEEELTTEALPAYITHRFTHLITECLVKEITGNNTPLMRQMAKGLAETFCLSDPSLPDNPIVYASEEFFKVTQYGQEYVLGRNCRFLQGPKTQQAGTRRLVEALTNGQEVCETILNYRRDGSPFLNLLLMAPLFDNKGKVRYFIGCQVDVSGLVINGHGLESFAQLLAQDRAESRFGKRGPHDKITLNALNDLGAILSKDERHVVLETQKARADDPEAPSPSRPANAPKAVGGRKIIGMDNDPEYERNLWPLPKYGFNGRLPGVYQNYMLVRPYPSLRITFTSPTLRIPGLLQSKFMDRIGAPSHIIEEIVDALAHGTGVTAKVNWFSQGDPNRMGGKTTSDGKPRWIHCTPLIGSDDRVGVWMVIMVEQEDITGALNVAARLKLGDGPPVTSSPTMLSPSIFEGNGLRGRTGSKFTGDKLYAEYLRREGRTDSRLDSRNDMRGPDPRTESRNETKVPRSVKAARDAGNLSKKALPRSPQGFQRSESRFAEQFHEF